MFGQSLLSAFGIACTTDTDQLFTTNQSATSTATYQLNNATTSIPSNTYPGTASNITYAAGKFGDAAVFNGSSSSIGISSSTINPANIYSISMWVSFDNASAYTGFFCNNTSAFRVGEISIMKPNATTLQIFSGGQAGTNLLDALTAQPTSAFVNNTWYHIVVISDRSISNQRAKVFVNGTECSYTAYAANQASVSTYSDTKIGLADNQFFPGKIDQVRIFNSDLSQAAVTALYNETTTTATSASVDYQLANPNSIAYYKMSDATDQIGGHTLTNSNVNFNTEGKFGFAGKFNGSNSKLTISNSSFLPQSNNSRSISCWIKTTGGSNDGVIGYGNAANSQAFFIYINSQNKLGIYCYYDNTDGTIAISNNTWNHVVATYDGTNCKLYVNGVLDFTTAKTLNTGNGEFRIGGVNWNNGGEFFPGDIDQIRIYDSALSAADVTTLYEEVECSAAAINALDYFNTKLYTGNGSTQSITGLGFKPDLTWIKQRSSPTRDHVLNDSVRGANKILYSNLSNAEDTAGGSGSAYFNSFDTNGFTVGSSHYYNGSGLDYVAWNWKAPLANLSTSFNGTTSRIELPKFPTLTGNVSVSGWVKLGNTATSNRLRFVELNLDNAGYAGTLMTLYKPSNGEWLVRAGNGTNSDVNILTHTYQLTQGVWYNICFTRNTSTNVTTFYVNNVQQDQETVTASASFPANATSIIGDVNYSTSYQYNWLGEMSQIRIFDDVLTTNEVSDIYTEPAASNNTLNYPAGAGCIAAYPLQTDAVDLSGNYSGASSNVTFGQPGYLTSNTDGTITSTVAANSEAGFSIVEYAGNGSAGATVGHGLTSPQMVMIKCTSTGSTNWIVYANSLGNSDYLTLNSSGAIATYTNWFYSNATTFTLNQTFGNANTSGRNYVAYCFTSIPGYSHIGSYVGTSASGNVQYLGFEPAFLMIKRTDGSGGWIMLDNKRSTSNPRTKYLTANTSDAEGDSASIDVDFLTNGFSVGGTNTDINVGTYIYLAIA